MLSSFRAKPDFLYSVHWVWRKLSPVYRGQNWVEERTLEFQFSDKKRDFEPSKMRDHEIEQMKER